MELLLLSRLFRAGAEEETTSLQTLELLLASSHAAPARRVGKEAVTGH
jgi:hypothetical protein